MPGKWNPDSTLFTRYEDKLPAYTVFERMPGG